MIVGDDSAVKDFFISYNSADRLWAQWIAWQLEQENYSVVLQSWTEQNFIQNMQHTRKHAHLTIVVLSPDYLDDLYKEAAWTETIAANPKNLLPVQVRECRQKLKGLLSLIVYIDLVGRDENDAREALLTGVKRTHNRPATSLSSLNNKTEQPSFPNAFPPIWNVPKPNPFFTDREEILAQLHATFAHMSKQANIQPQAISGLGGIGKTQIAIEYAYHYRHDYQTVLWMPADSHTTLLQSCLKIAHLLDLPAKDSLDQNEAIIAVQIWLKEHVNWLLILDNTDDLTLARTFLPSIAKGHVLITTRAQATGHIAWAHIVHKMTKEEGALFLLRRAGIVGPGAMLDNTIPEHQDAMNIVQMMDGLPLALDQAGAYIEEIGCTISDYRQLYKTHRQELLRRRGNLSFDHPEPVATTWSLSFQHIQQANPVAAEILKFCAFLSPDEIPEVVITRGTAETETAHSSQINDPLTIDAAIAELRKYSLIRRHPENKTFSIHRLVQTVLRDAMTEEEQRQWVQRTIHIISYIFPEANTDDWKLCQSILPHAQECRMLITQWRIESLSAAQLLRKTGVYLRDRAHYANAERTLLEALAMHNKVAPHIREYAIIHIQNDLAILYEIQGKYTLAEEHYLDALSIIEKAPDIDNFTKVSFLNALATLYETQGKYTLAEAYYLDALSIIEKTSGAEQVEIIGILNALAVLYYKLGEYDKSHTVVQSILIASEDISDAESLEIVSSLEHLATFYSSQQQYELVRLLLQRSISIYEQTLGSEHPYVASSLDSLAKLYLDQQQYAQAEPLLQRSLSIHQKTFSTPTFFRANNLYNLARLYHKEGKYELAEPLYQEALVIYEQFPEVLATTIIDLLHHLTALFRETQHFDQAAILEQRTTEIQNSYIDNPIEE